MLRELLIFLTIVALPASLCGQDRALPPEAAAKGWQLPPGFSATLFAGEPDLVQPMSFTFDDRGRIWVVEALTYPTWKKEGPGSDRITIFEDTDGDGRHDKRTVFLDNGLNVSSVEVGFGGIWLTAVPNLLFIPDKNGDDVPDGPPQVLLDGFDLGARHNVVGNLAWGPDGWLYGLNGILSNSKIGKPGTPDDKRIPINCGVWRYHPVRHEVEAYAHGTTNPWGIDWDERGQMFITNCVIKHIFHVMPGAHFTRMYGQDLNPHVYGLIESCADHQHWAGGHWTSSRGGHGAHGDAGGGHAHSGCMIYLGDNWPDEYRGDVFLVNIHGQRLNRDKLVPTGSTYVAQHAPDFAFSKDPWFRGIHVKYGPDGGVYVSDWSDHGECHDHKSEEECDKTGGRIFKIVYGEARQSPHGDLVKLTDSELVALQTHKNEWFARHSRRILQERAAAGKLDRNALQPLRECASTHVGPHDLKAMFTLHATGDFDPTIWANSPSSSIRGQALVLAAENRRPHEHVLKCLAYHPPGNTSPVIRLHAAAALQRLPIADRWDAIKMLVSFVEDADDHYLPLMNWYALEPVVAADTRGALALLPEIKIPLVRQYLTRRLIALYDGESAPNGNNAGLLDELVRVLNKSDDPKLQVDLCAGLCDAFRGRRSMKMPASWPEAAARLKSSPIPQVKNLAYELAVVFGDRDVATELRQIALDERATPTSRARALEVLAIRPSADQVPLLLTLLDEAGLRGDAIRGLAAYEAQEIPGKLVALYATAIPLEKQDIIQTLTARPAFALALLDAIENGTIPRKDVSALIIRQLQALEDKAVNERLVTVWGNIRPASAEKKEKIATFKSQLTPEVVQQADRSQGRAVFAKNCATCHKLFDEGGKLAPELTGSQRANLDYVLDNVLDPSALVPREYRVQVLRLADGRIVQGVVKEETPHTLTVETANETIRVPIGEIEARKESPLSMMPEGLFDRLTADEVRDLVAYLASPQQVPLPKSTP
ncbi:MAG: c-type cytochrome [Pirellulaceae bacterium]|nr:c-type cytochrome [Pirellulaceae bacterium]